MGTCGENWEDCLQWSLGNNLLEVILVMYILLTFPAYAFYSHQRDIPSPVESGLHCMVVALCRGCAVAVAAFEDRIAIFPTSMAAGNNIVDKVPLLPFLSPV